ncbi:hypothetical protein BDC45DRAFT_572779 [Circinella umbellata]|nr:hypothetical protein BDC45DRAFT_572779 [Circinella umbellata]
MNTLISCSKRAYQRIPNKLTLHELSGSLGDLGAVLPIMFSLTLTGQISLTSTLWFGEIWNILSRVRFQVPMCVQPTKNIAATVLSSRMPIEKNMSAGLEIQLGAADSLIKRAHNLVSSLTWTISADSCALILFAIGLTFALIRMFGIEHDTLNSPRPVIAWGKFPLTVLNSLIALSALVDDLFSDHHADTATISMSIGVMNLIGCWFGSMPFCHGSGGLAGQYRFGARSEVFVIILGLSKLLLGTLFGSSLLGLLEVFPKWILGKQKENWTIMLTIMGVIIAYSNVGTGIVAGSVFTFLLSVQRLGARKWYVSFIQGIKDIPSKWKHQDAFMYKCESAVAKTHYGDLESFERQPLLGCKNSDLSKAGEKTIIGAISNSKSSSSSSLH